MELFFIYLLKATGLLSLFLLFYRAFLYKETHFQVSRWFLLFTIGILCPAPLDLDHLYRCTRGMATRPGSG
ncbi:hypothetical protein [Aureicoccus marinus]|uniref:hypothetical protein n=1 Tax=Aureicoccus marinus TaxID=754435 RepID=UPI001C61504F|nr:hypothetical protein [Aureicoccus marinus]